MRRRRRRPRPRPRMSPAAAVGKAGRCGRPLSAGAAAGAPLPVHGRPCGRLRQPCGRVHAVRLCRRRLRQRRFRLGSYAASLCLRLGLRPGLRQRPGGRLCLCLGVRVVVGPRRRGGGRREGREQRLRCSASYKSLWAEFNGIAWSWWGLASCNRRIASSFGAAGIQASPRFWAPASASASAFGSRWAAPARRWAAGMPQAAPAAPTGCRRFSPASTVRACATGCRGVRAGPCRPKGSRSADAPRPKPSPSPASAAGVPRASRLAHPAPPTFVPAGACRPEPGWVCQGVCQGCVPGCVPGARVCACVRVCTFRLGRSRAHALRARSGTVGTAQLTALGAQGRTYAEAAPPDLSPRDKPVPTLDFKPMVGWGGVGWV